MCLSLTKIFEEVHLSFELNLWKKTTCRNYFIRPKCLVRSLEVHE
ncbi:hypothetical protein Lalb_Chr10g0099681 [Lupinus albus]|uniref:Uncharacterized protein n=1 Tax=Lupinus albus TaxID=3870 RepID=A0A6A4PVU7_LUPAL|nr:hypothetical protein Lalb_Chr10g0099681 [Lupinus albus]